MANAPSEMAPKANVKVARNHGWRGIDFNKKLAPGNLAGPYSSVHLTLAAHSFEGRTEFGEGGFGNSWAQRYPSNRGTLNLTCPVLRCQKCADQSDSSKNVTVVLGLEVASTRVGGRSEEFGLAMPEIALMFRDRAHLTPTTWGVVGLWWGFTEADPQFVGRLFRKTSCDQ